MSILVKQVRGSCHLQDRGRPNQSEIGIPTGGFADVRSAHLANQLVARPAFAPLLECTIGGPILMFKKACDIAITGADMQPRLKGTSVSMWQRIRVEAGDTLTCQHMRRGVRSYIAFSRPLVVDTWRGSVSPLTLGDQVFPESSMLIKGQVLNFSGDADYYSNRVVRTYVKVPSRFKGIDYNIPIIIQLQPAPESDLILLNERLLTELTDSTWSVSPVSNRVGIRLHGPSFALGKTDGMMRSGPVLPGTVQLLPSGHLIVTHVDSQTIGGYPRIGLVDMNGLGVLAQAEPTKTQLKFRF